MTTWAEFWATALDEIRALGWQCIAHGPEVLLAIGTIALVMAALVGAMALAMLVGLAVFGEEDDDEHKDDL